MPNTLNLNKYIIIVEFSVPQISVNLPNLTSVKECTLFTKYTWIPLLANSEK